MKKQLTRTASVLALTTAPFTVFAAATSFDALVTQLLNYIKLLVPFIIALAMLVFLWGIFKLVFAGGSDKDVTEGTKFMTWGIVSLFVMVSVWGLVNVLVRSFRLDNSAPPLPMIRDAF